MIPGSLDLDLTILSGFAKAFSRIKIRQYTGLLAIPTSTHFAARSERRRKACQAETG